MQVSGFYLRHADGSFEFADYATLQAADLANRLDNLRLLAGAGLTLAEVRRAEGLLPEAVAARGDGPAVLCHGELFPGHIFVAMGEDAAVTVTGLIDFGDACGGRPLDDLESLCWEWPEVDRAALAAGYGPAPFWNDQGPRLEPLVLTDRGTQRAGSASAEKNGVAGAGRARAHRAGVRRGRRTGHRGGRAVRSVAGDGPQVVVPVPARPDGRPCGHGPARGPRKITDEQAGIVVTRTLNERGPGRTRTNRPRPFIWTKTADEILETLAAYCQRINDSGCS